MSRSCIDKFKSSSAQLVSMFWPTSREKDIGDKHEMAPLVRTHAPLADYTGTALAHAQSRFQSYLLTKLALEHVDRI